LKSKQKEEAAMADLKTEKYALMNGDKGILKMMNIMNKWNRMN